MKVQLVVSLSLIGIMFALDVFASSVPAKEIKIDDSILKMVNEMAMKIQKETMAETYAAMPYKNQMRGQMMMQNAAKNSMQSAIQQQMMQKNMGTEKLKMMNRMSEF